MLSSRAHAPDGLGEKMRASALSLDGLIEAIEHRDMPFCVGVQWNPLRDAASAGLFAAFAEAASHARVLRA